MTWQRIIFFILIWPIYKYCFHSNWRNIKCDKPFAWMAMRVLYFFVPIRRKKKARAPNFIFFFFFFLLKFKLPSLWVVLSYHHGRIGPWIFFFFFLHHRVFISVRMSLHLEFHTESFFTSSPSWSPDSEPGWISISCRCYLLYYWDCIMRKFFSTEYQKIWSDITDHILKYKINKNITQYIFLV